MVALAVGTFPAGDLRRSGRFNSLFRAVYAAAMVEAQALRRAVEAHSAQLAASIDRALPCFARLRGTPVTARGVLPATRVLPRRVLLGVAHISKPRNIVVRRKHGRYSFPVSSIILAYINVAVFECYLFTFLNE